MSEKYTTRGNNVGEVQHPGIPMVGRELSTRVYPWWEESYQPGNNLRDTITQGVLTRVMPLFHTSGCINPGYASLPSLPGWYIPGYSLLSPVS